MNRSPLVYVHPYTDILYPSKINHLFYMNLDIYIFKYVYIYIERERRNAEEHTQHTCAHVVYVHSRPPAGRRRLFLLHHHLLPITRHAHASLYTHINITLTPYELIYPCINTCSDRWKHRRDIFDLTERSTVNYMAVGQTNLVSMLLSK